jgi:CHAT domain-containing protein
MEKRSNPRSREQSLVLSSPNYGIDQSSLRPSSTSRSSKRITWEALPYARKEGDLVSHILGAKHFYGDAADEPAIKSAKRPDILHVASHGYFRESESTEDTPSSAVVLAGANNTHPSSDNTSDGYLTAAELSRLDLYGTELVVLSACSTGQGDIRTGEGVYGLQRALTVAGARSTLLSLWKVDDEATAEFMERFYTRLKAGESRSDALAATQKEFRDGTAGNRQWRDPYYWAAWQLVGDWRPIKGL